MIEVDGVPALRRPIMIAAFEGWNDAADASSNAVEHLESAWNAVEIGGIDPEDYYDFQVNRPIVSMRDGVSRQLTWPTSRMSYAQLPDADRDVVLLRGLEPNMRWRRFCRELIDSAHALGVVEVATMGALLSDSPHTRPVPVTGSATDAATARRLGLAQSTYEGPTGIVGVFHDACIQEGMPSLAMWAAVPHYVAQPPCPKATLSLLRHLEDAIDLPLPYGELPELAAAWERGVDELAREDSEVAEYVRGLEQAKDEADLPEASGEAIAREFERYLRRRQGRGE